MLSFMVKKKYVSTHNKKNGSHLVPCVNDPLVSCGTPKMEGGDAYRRIMNGSSVEHFFVTP